MMAIAIVFNLKLFYFFATNINYECLLIDEFQFILQIIIEIIILFLFQPFRGKESVAIFCNFAVLQITLMMQLTVWQGEKRVNERWKEEEV